jgi:N-methylhydantoinase B
MTVFDGVDECYVPGDELTIDPALRLHRGTEVDIDPVTYEVIRSGLWNINEESGDIIRRVSGSPIAQFAHDLNTVLLTEDAEYLYSGPYNLNLAAVIDLAIKWILEHRSGGRGIREGDIFLTNDPFIGASHVTDVIMAAPIFVGGELFAWAASSMHQYDMGGTAPGGYSPDARNRFEEADPIPPVAIVEGDAEIRQDLLEWYLRRSRTPEYLELDLRSQIAGCNYAKRRIHALVDAYGADVVKGSMRKILDDGEAAFAARLAGIPAGTWSARSYLECAEPGDRALYPTVLNVTKGDGELTFDQRGTGEQTGVLSISYGAWRAGVIPPLVRMLCDDTQYALGGALRRLTFEPEAGSLMCASHPAATGNPGIGICQAGSLATVAISRMVATLDDPDQEVFAVAGTSVYPITALSGVDEDGTYFGTIHMEPMAGALGAFKDGDGEDTGGTVYDALGLAPNVEFSEQYFPILYLYRREMPGSGGAGRYRGGNSGVYGYVPHGADVVNHYTATSGVAVPTSGGLWAGLPGATNRDLIKTGTDVWEHLAAGRIPQELESLGGQTRNVAPKERDVLQRRADVWEQQWAAGGGYGDPLLRAVEAVLEDVLGERLSAEQAEHAYGVVLAGGQLDGAGTEARRAELRAGRLGKAGVGLRAEPIDGRVRVVLGPSLEIVEHDGADVARCRSCRTSLGALAGWKTRAIDDEVDVQDANPHIGDASIHVDARLVVRTYCCPGCGAGLDAEIAIAGEPPFEDIVLAAP